MSAGGHTVWHPRAHDVKVSDGRPREIIVRLASGTEIELWPEGVDHCDQVAWLQRAEQALRQARALMTECCDCGVDEVT